MKIKITSFSKPLKKLPTNKINTSLIKFIKILEDDPDFKQKIVDHRVALEIPNSGFRLKRQTAQEEIVEVYLRELRKNLNNPKKTNGVAAAYQLCEAYGLSTSGWHTSFFNLIFFDVLTAPLIPCETVSILTDTSLSKEIKGIKTAWLHPNEFIYIRINKKVGKTKLIKTIGDKWSKIKKLLDQHALEDPLPNVNIQILDMYKKIYKLRMEGVTFPQIAEKIQEENHRGYEDSEIRTMFYRYRKKINSLKKDNNQKKQQL